MVGTDVAVSPVTGRGAGLALSLDPPPTITEGTVGLIDLVAVETSTSVPGELGTPTTLRVSDGHGAMGALGPIVEVPITSEAYVLISVVLTAQTYPVLEEGKITTLRTEPHEPGSLTRVAVRVVEEVIRTEACLQNWKGTIQTRPVGIVV